MTKPNSKCGNITGSPSWGPLEVHYSGMFVEDINARQIWSFKLEHCQQSTLILWAHSPTAA